MKRKLIAAVLLAFLSFGTIENASAAAWHHHHHHERMHHHHGHHRM